MGDAMRMGRRGFLRASAALAAGPWFHGAWRWRPRRAVQDCWQPLGPTTSRGRSNLLIIFLTGGFSHVDTFDYKPELNR